MSDDIEAYAVVVMVPVSHGRPAPRALETARKIRTDIVAIYSRTWRDVGNAVVIEAVLRKQGEKTS